MSVHNGLALKSAHGFDSDVGIAVKKATNEALTAPDWELITSICDLCRSSALWYVSMHIWWMTLTDY